MKKNINKLTLHYMCLSHFANSLSCFRKRVAFQKTLDGYISGSTHRHSLLAGNKNLRIQMQSLKYCVGFELNLDVKPKEVNCKNIMKWMFEAKYSRAENIDFIVKSNDGDDELLQISIYFNSNSLSIIRELIKLLSIHLQEDFEIEK